jgi:hypothetical protein
LFVGIQIQSLNSFVCVLFKILEAFFLFPTLSPPLFGPSSQASPAVAARATAQPAQNCPRKPAAQAAASLLGLSAQPAHGRRRSAPLSPAEADLWVPLVIPYLTPYPTGTPTPPESVLCTRPHAWPAHQGSSRGYLKPPTAPWTPPPEPPPLLSRAPPEPLTLARRHRRR